MVPFRPQRPSASVLAWGGAAAISAAIMLCFPPAWAQAVPNGAAGAKGKALMQARSERLARSAAQIETVVLANRMEMGVGGMFLAKPKPVALFRGGDALLRMENLNRVTSVEADRAAYPKDWSRWKRTAGGIELLQGDKWKKPDYPRMMERLPAGFALSGDYQNLTGGGNTAVGGGEILVAANRYSFRQDGRYSSNRSSSFSDPGVITTSKGPVLEGRYHVDGYLLRLEPAAGEPETHLIVIYPTDPSVLWIDGRGYTRGH